MNITPVTSGGNASQTETQVQSKTTLTQQDFMNLFMTQMKFQNPLEPLDNNQMATQVAQFNTVDALARMNETLNQLMANQSSLGNLQATSLIGKKVEARGDRLTLQQGAASEGVYQLDRPGEVIVQILDDQGKLVRQIEAGFKDTSRQTIGWNGKDQSGKTLPDGMYAFRVLAADSKGEEIPVSAHQVGTVTGVSLENGTAYFQLGGDKITLGDILAIMN